MPSAITTTAKKRKSLPSATSKSEDSHKRRKTLDAFFAPQVTLTLCKASSEGEAKIIRENVTLNAEQVGVLKMVVDEGKSVFFTGAAGTGKSLLLRAIISSLVKKHSKTPEVISITASTGMAASNIGGMTIHSWGAVTPGLADVERQISCIKTCKPAFKRWKATKVLIIDEVSMVDGQLFEMLATLADRLRKKTDKPFGGIQLVITGDFFQLPPVTKGTKDPFFAFECEAWKRCIERTVTLKTVYRQKDTQFIELLNELRHGTISPSTYTLFASLSRPLPPPPTGPPLLPTELYPLRAQVDSSNSSRLASLPGRTMTYYARDSGTQQKMLENLKAPKEVVLKRDAQVMLVKNVDGELVNGCVGRVLGFWRVKDCWGSVGKSDAGENTGKPKSTGVPETTMASTLKIGGLLRNVQVGPDGRTPRALYGAQQPAAPENKENVAATTPQSKDKVAKEKKLTGTAAKEDEIFPLVEFRTASASGAGVEIVLIGREEFRVEDNEGKLLARRVQVPLVLAWAMSIHKSQGQTIQRVKIDLGRVFEKGQSYVALSRASSLDGLQVIGFNSAKVQAHPKVIAWSRSLEEASPAAP